MSQTMMAVWDEAGAVELARIERKRLADLAFVENYGRGLGLQTEEIRKRALFPNWAWDDYSI